MARHVWARIRCLPKSAHRLFDYWFQCERTRTILVEHGPPLLLYDWERRVQGGDRVIDHMLRDTWDIKPSTINKYREFTPAAILLWLPHFPTYPSLQGCRFLPKEIDDLPILADGFEEMGDPLAAEFCRFLAAA